MRIAIFGYYGCKNFGDEALLDCLFSDLSIVVPTGATTVLTHGSTKPLRSSRPASDYVRLSDRARVVRLLLSSDVVIAGGGSVLKDAANRGGLSVLLGVWPLVIASLLARRVVYYSVGVGVLRQRRGRDGLSALAGMASASYARDANALALFERAGTPVAVGLPDALLTPTCVPQGTRRQPASVMIAPSSSLRTSDPDRAWGEDRIGTAVRDLQAAGWTVALGIFHGGTHGDLGASCNMGLPGVEVVDFSELDFSTAIDRLARWDTVVTDRLHAAECAAIAGCRLLVRLSDPKLEALADRLDIEGIGVHDHDVVKGVASARVVDLQDRQYTTLEAARRTFLHEALARSAPRGTAIRRIRLACWSAAAMAELLLERGRRPSKSHAE